MTYRQVFTYDHLYKSALKCFRGVGWKREVQIYKNTLCINIISLQKKLYNHTYKSKGFYEFDICERGKQRHIKAVYLEERIVQKCLCDYYLIPTLIPTLIYDSGASQKGKGTTFTINRLIAHMQKHYREYGTSGYYLKFDFTQYFENIDHKVLKTKLDRYITDCDLKDLTYYFIDNCGECGLGLGSQVSQICSLLFISSLDHFIKEQLHIHHYVRYMDDALLIHYDKVFLQECLIKIRDYCKGLCVVINENKTQIIKLTRGIRFLKRQYILTENGKILRFIDKGAYTRIKHKLGIKPYVSAFNSWRGSYMRYNCYWQVYNIERKYSLV